MSSLRTKSLKSRKGFTLIEVMVAAVILGLTSFALLALLRSGDQLAMRARVNGAVAAQVKARGGLLVSAAYSDLNSLQGVYYRGGLDGLATPQLPDALRLPGDGNPGDLCYLVKGKPLPGTTAYRDLGKYLETVEVSETAPGVLSVEYTLRWEDPTGQPSASSVNNPRRLTDVHLNFIRYDPYRY